MLRGSAGSWSAVHRAGRCVAGRLRSRKGAAARECTRDRLPLRPSTPRRSGSFGTCWQRAAGGEAARAAPAPISRRGPIERSRFGRHPAGLLDWAGSFRLGNVGAHVYVEFDSPALDLARLGVALGALVRRHDMLRAVILPGGQQQVLRDVPAYDVAVLDLSARPPLDVDAELDVLRTQLSHQVCPTDRWPLFDLRVTVLPGQRIRIHFGIDLLIADLRSIYILLTEWFQLYVDPDVALPALRTSFREYVLRERELEGTDAFARAEALAASAPDSPPAPELPLAKNRHRSSPRFTVGPCTCRRSVTH